MDVKRLRDGEQRRQLLGGARPRQVAHEHGHAVLRVDPRAVLPDVQPARAELLPVERGDGGGGLLGRPKCDQRPTLGAARVVVVLAVGG